MNDNIFLIGFMGAGKSTVARCLHRCYGREMLEMDGVIEEREEIGRASCRERVLDRV